MNKQKIVKAIAEHDDLIEKCKKVIESDPAAVNAKVPAFMERVKMMNSAMENKKRLEEML